MQSFTLTQFRNWKVLKLTLDYFSCNDSMNLRYSENLLYHQKNNMDI